MYLLAHLLTFACLFGCFLSSVALCWADTRPSFVADTVYASSDESWVLNCTQFNVSGTLDAQASVFDYDPEKTSICSFEACAGRYYEVEVTNCVNNATAELFSYGGTDKSDDLVASVSCGETVVIDGFGRSGGLTAGSASATSQCHLVSVYQTCREDDADQVHCSGQTIVTAKSYPPIDVQWVDALLATPGYPLRYMISNFTVNDNTAQSYLAADTSDLYIAIYKTDMLEDQEYCDYVSFDGSSTVQFFDYIDFSNWDGLEKTAYVTTTSTADPPVTDNYIVSEFGGNYRVVVWLWRKTFIGMDRPYMLAYTDKVRIHGTASLIFTITYAWNDDFVNGTYTFTNALTEIGDEVVMYALNEEGTCHFNHPKNEYDQALWHQSITTANETSGTFSTSQSTLAGGEPFRLPALDAACNGREQVFEVRYMRGGEVLGRTVVQAIASPTSAPTGLSAESAHGDDDHTTEYAILISIIVVAVVGALVYVLCFQKHSPPSEEELVRGQGRAQSDSRISGRGSRKGGFLSVSSASAGAVPSGEMQSGREENDQRSDIDKFLDEVDPSLFQIEMVGVDEDDEEELIF